MSQRVIVFDLETIPCTDTLARLHGRETMTDDEAADLLGTKFPKLPLHKVAVLAALVAERTDGVWRIRSLGAPHIGERSEAELISAFAGRVEALRPTLVTFNGSGFDLPVLRYRAMINAIAAPGLTCRPYFKRYDASHVDLCDELASFQSNAKVGLDDLCRMMGLPGKPVGIDGSRVWDHVRAGRIQECADYGETDVVNTYRVWLRHELFRGAITPEQLAASEAQLTSFIRARLHERSHLGFLIGADLGKADLAKAA
ncbi:3'-5' exonuclease [uncultured Brevundimonas sp.]|uniref:3'-5' exonuclease n=1 Tax=uncultured Brevundimonas sp. TaxID=213418 RepID=UPI0025D0DFE3|nr:3'-5' exonuclease [uncultured Brevundimonas sp.]